MRVRASGLLAMALVAPMPPVAAAAERAAELRTLFHSPSERERLDKLRRGEHPRGEAADPVSSASPPVITGFVRRSDARDTIWINGIPVPVAGATARSLLDPRRARDVPPRAEGADIEIKRSR